LNSIICTLFESHYHCGVAALTNSLHKQGFKGSIFAGYKGSLPKWATAVRNNASFAWQGSTVLQVANGLQIYFLPLETDYHLTNYKPDFLLEVLQRVHIQPTSIFYFDPDIVISSPWNYIQEWVDCGIALCEDVNSPISKNNPRRIAWRKFFGDKGFNLKFKDSIYVNGGFIGASISDVSFIQMWKQLQEEMATEIGGLNRSSLTGLELPEKIKSPYSPFSKTDQDALNAAVEGWQGIVSLAGKEAMAFAMGTVLFPHALGVPKPWQCNYLRQAFAGYAPRLVDKKYWDCVDGPLKLFSNNLISRKKLAVALASFIGRFYQRSRNGY
jgi:hypothetical protein